MYDQCRLLRSTVMVHDPLVIDSAGATGRERVAGGREPNARRHRGVPVTLREVLASSRRPTRLELVCWELNVDERLARPAWELALRNGLLEAAGAAMPIDL